MELLRISVCIDGGGWIISTATYDVKETDKSYVVAGKRIGKHEINLIQTIHTPEAYYWHYAYCFPDKAQEMAEIIKAWKIGLLEAEIDKAKAFLQYTTLGERHRTPA